MQIQQTEFLDLHRKLFLVFELAAVDSDRLIGSNTNAGNKQANFEEIIRLPRWLTATRELAHKPERTNSQHGEKTNIIISADIKDSSSTEHDACSHTSACAQLQLRRVHVTKRPPAGEEGEVCWKQVDLSASRGRFRRRIIIIMTPAGPLKVHQSAHHSTVHSLIHSEPAGWSAAHFWTIRAH